MERMMEGKGRTEEDNERESDNECVAHDPHFSSNI